MAKTVTLSSLYSKIRTRANVRSVKFTDQILDEMIKAEILSVLDIIYDKNPTYGLKPYSDLDITSGTATVSLPSDFYKLYGVRVKDSDGQWKRIGRFSWEDFDDDGTTLTNRTELKYHEDGATLRFNQTPGWTLTGGLRVFYVAVPTIATAAYGASPTSWDAIFGWDRYVVWSVVEEILTSKRHDVTAAHAQKSQAERIIRMAAARRDLVNPPRQIDFRGRTANRRLPPP